MSDLHYDIIEVIEKHTCYSRIDATAHGLAHAVKKIFRSTPAVYQVWHETNVGPTFLTRKEALVHLGYDSEEAHAEDIKGYGYPAIREIVLGKDINWDR